MNPFQIYRAGALTVSRGTTTAQNRESEFRQIQAWWASNGRTDFVTAFDHETALNLASAKRSQGARIEQGFPKNINEYNGKLKWDQYYIANALMALEQIDRILQAPPQAGEPWILYFNLHAVACDLLHDTLVLIEDWATYSAQVPGITGTGKNRLEEPLALYHSAAQIIHGNLSPFSFLDNHADTAINQIRMAIEMRFRRGFGVIAKIDAKGAIVPLALSEIIAAAKNYQADISFSVPLQHIERLYGWANIYMHAGIKQYAWSSIVALYYLKAFLLGGVHRKGSSVYAGISAKASTVRQVQAKVESGIDKQRYTLVKIEPAQCDIVLK